MGKNATTKNQKKTAELGKTNNKSVPQKFHLWKKEATYLPQKKT